MEIRCTISTVCFLIIFLGLNGQVAGVYDVATAKTLYTYLTTNYNIHLRPSNQVMIRVEFSAMSVNALDVKNELFSITGWLTVIWTGDQLKWTPSSYNDIEYMFLNEDYIWKPELVIQNSATNVPIIDNDELYLKVSSDGTVQWDPPGVYVVSCDVDITYYPFDTQSCYVAVSTWSYDNSLLELVHYKSGVNLEDYQENGEWELKSTRVTSATKQDRNNAAFTRDKLLFHFTMERKTSYYVLNIILPPLLTSFLGLMVFVLPAESGEKVGYSITVLLALAVLLTIITTYIPTTSERTSVFGVYLVVMLIVSAVEVIITILVLRLHHKADKDIPVSDSMQKFVHVFLARTSCFRSIVRPRCCDKRNKEASEKGRIKKSQISPNVTLDVIENGTLGFSGIGSKENHETSKPDMVLATKEKHGEDPNDNRKEYTWPEIAMMVDITALYSIFIIMVISTVVFTLKLSNNS